MAVAFIPTVGGRALHRAHELAMPPSLTLDQIVDFNPNLIRRSWRGGGAEADKESDF
jgi:hypothetical protein